MVAQSNSQTPVISTQMLTRWAHTVHIHHDVVSMRSFPPIHSAMSVQAFLGVLARDYEWECNADEKWITAENQRCADLPVAIPGLHDTAGMLNAKTSSTGLFRTL